MSQSLPGSPSCCHNSPFLIHYGNSFYFGPLFSHSVNDLCKSCNVKLKPSALCLQTRSCFSVYNITSHSSKWLILKWCPVKVRWVWTEPICLDNCVLPQSKLSYRVFIKIELPQCELTILQRRCDMSTKQPISHEESLSSRRLQLNHSPEQLDKSNPQKAGSCQPVGNSDRSKTVFIAYLEKPGERRDRDTFHGWNVHRSGQWGLLKMRSATVLVGQVGLLSWNISGKSDFRLTVSTLLIFPTHEWDGVRKPFSDLTFLFMKWWWKWENYCVWVQENLGGQIRSDEVLAFIFSQLMLWNLENV